MQCKCLDTFTSQKEPPTANRRLFYLSRLSL
nr:MAG TPA: hypothetical protein [Caudoviricetes sp.]DAT88092.1 MAG TPA: hypothetical protein [Caudoviricetes sp.]DAU57009.1 MAG TPA: hypothetical protein [Caudoviricetes sp.]DAX49408.1 MAG TPA: hypothetical protein [Caudoviricetes sp.]DAZ79197.1 MAG TPA: hypothetical protein [Caudoviricetes sp.]